ncbi:hypothetical protein AAIE21_20465 [Paenibacillus sp. 102]|uniref:hypothetical protein n=1 Tax=Paenibacillus sp. 102 TaxID=3120823 RepID=UPI0031BAC9E1
MQDKEKHEVTPKQVSYEEMKEDLRILAENNPDSGDIQMQYAKVLFQLSELNEAYIYCKKAMENGYCGADSNLILGGIYLNLGRFEKAKDYLTAYHELEPDDPVGLTYYGSMLRLVENNEDGFHYICQAYKLEPENILVECNYFFTKASLINKKNEKEVINELMSGATSEWKRQLYLSIAAMKRAKFSKSSTHAKKAFELNPTDPRTRNIYNLRKFESNFLLLPHLTMMKMKGKGNLYFSLMIILCTISLFALGFSKIPWGIIIAYIAFLYMGSFYAVRSYKKYNESVMKKYYPAICDDDKGEK